MKSKFEKLSSAAQRVDAALDPIKIDSDPARIATKTAGFGGVVLGAYFMRQGMEMPDSSLYPHAKETLTYMGTVSALEGLALVTASMRHSEDRTPLSEHIKNTRGTYHKWAADKAKLALEDDQRRINLAKLDSNLKGNEEPVTKAKARAERRRSKLEAKHTKHASKLASL